MAQTEITHIRPCEMSYFLREESLNRFEAYRKAKKIYIKDFDEVKTNKTFLSHDISVDDSVTFVGYRYKKDEDLKRNKEWPLFIMETARGKSHTNKTNKLLKSYSDLTGNKVLTMIVVYELSESFNKAFCDENVKDIEKFYVTHTSPFSSSKMTLNKKEFVDLLLKNAEEALTNNYTVSEEQMNIYFEKLIDLTIEKRQKNEYKQHFCY